MIRERQLEAAIRATEWLVVALGVFNYVHLSIREGNEARDNVDRWRTIRKAQREVNVAVGGDGETERSVSPSLSFGSCNSD